VGSAGQAPGNATSRSPWAVTGGPARSSPTSTGTSGNRSSAT